MCPRRLRFSAIETREISPHKAVYQGFVGYVGSKQKRRNPFDLELVTSISINTV
jgi:hypothetical protein